MRKITKTWLIACIIGWMPIFGIIAGCKEKEPDFVPSNDATLKSLTVSAGKLTPEFNASTTNYTVNVPRSVTNISLTGAANHASASVTGNVNQQNLEIGHNEFEIVVTAEDGTTAVTYAITAIRADVTSGRVNTSDKFVFRYGRMDLSIKLPKTANGLWPAAWLLGDNLKTVGWPQCGEIDLLEMGSQQGIIDGQQDRFLSRGTHWGEVVSGGGHPNYALHSVFPQSLQEDFHLYVFTWDETYIRMYFDPELDENQNIKPGNTPYYEILINVYDGQYPVGEYFHKPFFVLLNLAVGGQFTGIYSIDGITALNSGNNYKADMYIDFVKVYKNNMELVWSDPFDSENLDETKWNIEENSDGGGNQELQTYSRQNVSTGAEPETGKKCLILTAKRHFN
jgi:beta-glucanase (GH16 family)